MDRLRNRDLRTNNNKCYTMYFDDDQNKDITNKTSMPAKKGKSRSPRKKEPIKNVNANESPNVGDCDAKTVDEAAENVAAMASETDPLSSDNKVSDCSEAVEKDNGADRRAEECKGVNGGATAPSPSSSKAVAEAENDAKSLVENNKQASIEPNKNGAQNDSDRKRRLSQSCSDRNEDIDDEDDEDAESNETGSLIYSGKKPKIEFSKTKMFQTYQPWVIKTYGDLAKTKTITLKKHQRILKALNGQEQNNPDSSKFRFWVKAKGFTTEKPPNFKEVPIFDAQIDTIDCDSNSSGVSNGASTSNAPTQQQQQQQQQCMPTTSEDGITTHLYVPNLTKEIGIQPYRKVAVVEQFFDIIYNVHVGLGGRSGRHAGQKRTYRTITESYAFLPRDAVTKFLAGCHICKKSPRACSPSRLDDTYCTESSSEMDILNYSPKSMSDISVTSNEQRMPTPLSGCMDANVSTSLAAVAAAAASAAPKIDLNGIEKNDDNKNVLAALMAMPSNHIASQSAPNANLNGNLASALSTPNNSSGGSTSGNITNDDVYVDEIYRKISEYYRGIFSNIDIKDPNISADVLNYYHLIRQFYEQTMAINIQRNTAMGLTALTTATDATGKDDLMKAPVNGNAKPAIPNPSDVSTIDLTIHKPAPTEPLAFNNIKNSNSFQNNININIGASNGDETPKDRPVLANVLAKVNDVSMNDVSENKVTISSAGVSINVSSLNSNSLKISCKTTPPKKRYSVYNHPEDAPVVERTTTPKAMHVAPINLNRKFDVESLVVAAAATTKKSGSSSSSSATINDESALVKSNFTVDALRTNATAFESNKSSPVTSVDSSSSITDIIPITSTYLKMMQSMGFSVEDAMKFDNVEPITTLSEGQSEPQHIEDPYAGLMKDADKLKLMLLAWNYQNSNAAARNGAEAPDLSVVGNLWAQYQNALAMNSGVKLPSASPPQTEQSLNSPTIENPDESSSSGQKDDDDASEDDSDDRLDQNAHDPERLKAFNMFVRLFVDENLDRMIPISKQPKEKIQAIIDSCTRQFPEFSERARKRIRTYLKSCRRNKKTREGWEATTSRPTPAHLTSVQAEQILAMACENESMNAKRMRIGLDPISQTIPLANANSTNEGTGTSINYPLGFKTEPDAIPPNNVSTPPKTNIVTNTSETKPLLLGVATNLTNGNAGLNSTSLYRQDINSPAFTSRAQQYQNYFTNSLPTSTTAITNPSPTDLSMKQPAQPLQLTMSQQPSQQSIPPQQVNLQMPNSQPASAQNQSLQPQPIQNLSMQQQQQPIASIPQQPQQQQQQVIEHHQQQQQQQAPQRLPLLQHKLNPSEMSAVRQLVTGYRESAAFLLRSADELETLLLNQNHN